ncbi:MAG: hypothetical protein MJZ75_05635 [Paludibacteraceae bacterium]|nr:hypothetical protein [Paludibacteraceae bacterium]
MGQDTIELEIIDLQNAENKSILNPGQRKRLITEKRTFLYDDILAITTTSKYRLDIVPKGEKGEKKRFNLLFVQGRTAPFLLKKTISDIEALLWDDYGRCVRGNLIKIGVHLFVNRDACNTPISKYQLIVDGIERPLLVSQAEAQSFNALWEQHNNFLKAQGPKNFGKLLLQLGEAYEKSCKTLSHEELERRQRYFAHMGELMREGVEEYVEEQKNNLKNKEEK